MDTSKAVTHIGLCAGYGGIELGLRRVIRNLRSVALCEIEAFAIANLVAKMEAGLMDPAPIWPDLKTFPWAAFRDRVDILTGGYPCQPFSAAGQRRGKDDPRHLWPYIADGIRLLRPRLCFFENVEGHISLGLSDVIEDLAGMGYRTTWGIFSASEVGAPHQRKRVFILAISGSLGGAAGLSGSFPRHEGQSGKPDDRGHQAWPSSPGEQQHGWEPPRVVGDAEGRQDNGREPRDMEGEAREGGCGDNAADGSGEELADTSHNESKIGESDDSVGKQRTQDGWREQFSSGIGAGGRTSRGASAPGDERHQTSAGNKRPYCGNQLGDTNHGRQPSGIDTGSCTEASGGGQGDVEQAESGQTQPSLGGDADGSSGGMEYAELCVSGDNRTDELRLLGNGVVPATAERAFRVLIKELL